MWLPWTGLSAIRSRINSLIRLFWCDGGGFLVVCWWFGMVCGGFWWFLVVWDGLWWFLVIKLG